MTSVVTTCLRRFAAASAVLGIACGQTIAQPVLSTDKPRPVMELMRQLENRYGWRIAYEEAPYENASDLVNVVSPVYLATHPGARLLIPKPQQLSVTVPAGAPVASAIGSIIDRANTNEGRSFAVSFDGDFAYIVPMLYRKKDGTVAAFQPMLDTPVNFAIGERTIRETVNRICTQVAAARGIPINEGTIPTNLYHELQTAYANNEPARVVLSRIFETASAGHEAMAAPPIRATWDLLYDANEKAYYLNTHVIPAHSPNQ